MKIIRVSLFPTVTDFFLIGLFRIYIYLRERSIFENSTSCIFDGQGSINWVSYYAKKGRCLLLLRKEKLTRHHLSLNIGKLLVVHGKIGYRCPTADLQIPVLAGVQRGDLHLQLGGGGHQVILMMRMRVVSH